MRADDDGPRGGDSRWWVIGALAFGLFCGFILGLPAGGTIDVEVRKAAARKEMLAARNLLDDWWELRHAENGVAKHQVEARP